jgi:hypothetical protein
MLDLDAKGDSRRAIEISIYSDRISQNNNLFITISRLLSHNQECVLLQNNNLGNNT